MLTVLLIVVALAVFVLLFWAMSRGNGVVDDVDYVNYNRNANTQNLITYDQGPGYVPPVYVEPVYVAPAPASTYDPSPSVDYNPAPAVSYDPTPSFDPSPSGGFDGGSSGGGGANSDW